MWFIIATCSALFSATAAVVQKKILFRLNALEFSFLVSLVLLICSVFIPFSTDTVSLPSETLALLIGKSILGGLAFLLVMMSLEHNQISGALPILGMTPAVTAVFALVLLGESLHGSEWIGIGLMMVGTYVLETRPSQGFLHPFRAALRSRNHYYMYGALALFAISSVADKLLVSGFKIPPLVVLFYQHIVYCALFGLLVFVRRSSFRLLVEKGREYLPFIAGAALLTLAYRWTQLEATRLAPVALVLAVKRTSILYASFFGGKLFSEERLAQKLIGGALIVAAGFMILRNVA